MILPDDLKCSKCGSSKIGFWFNAYMGWKIYCVYCKKPDKVYSKSYNAIRGFRRLMGRETKKENFHV